MTLTFPQIYPITDRELPGLSHPEQVQKLVDAGARVIQIRDKTASARDLYEAVCQSLEIARPAGAKIIVNDRVDVALAARADGVHVGRDDLPAEKARAVLGPEAIIGVSTHTIGQVSEARQLPVAYIAFGPMYSTATKSDTEPEVGLDLLRSACKLASPIPIVAIGGINKHNIAAVLSTGAASAAVISAIVGQPADIAENFTRLTVRLNVT